jgi:enamine deaminase RidA (YjgF/YER057c/UK114 family)
MAQQVINLKGLEHPEGSPNACKIGPLLVSGAIYGKDPETGKMPDSVDEQARNAFLNMKRILAVAGMGVDDVAKLTIYVRSDDYAGAARKAWAECFPDPQRRPTRRTLEAKIHVGLVQLEIIAYKAP